jgi:16S rRNA (cytosine967-C5)-methyltransferase
VSQTARDVARQVLRRVEQGEAYATLALGGALARAHLSPADRAFVTEVVYGVLRHRTRLDRALAACAPRGLAKLPAPAWVALRVAAYQLLAMRVPAHAAVDDAVRALKRVLGPRMGSFGNALLRRLATQGEPPPPDDPRRRLEEWHSTPAWIAERLAARLGLDEAERAAEAMNRPAPLTLRASLHRTGRAELAERLAREVGPRPAPSPGPASPVESYLPEALSVGYIGAVDQLASFQEGLFTVQDAAAQLVGRMCGARPGERILDACAGVGGKSTHLAQLALLLGGPATIFAADLSRRKLDLLEDSARRLGLGGIQPVLCDVTDPSAPLAPDYDRVLLDAPCSGLGVLRRHPEGKWRRRPEEVPALAALQARLLDALASRVRPGGVLVYSVCTFTDEEGPEQVRRFLAAHPDFAVTDPAAAVPPDVRLAPFLGEDRAFRSWPHRHDADGFFAVRLSRRAAIE